MSNTTKKEFPFYANDLLINNDTIYLATTFTTKFKLKNIEYNPNLSLNNGLFFRSRTNVLKLGNKNTIWLGSSSGLYNYTIKDSIQFYGNYYSALQGSINDLFFDDNQNRLIVASASKGILVLKNNKLVHSISYKNNLNNNTVNTIEKIDTNNFLIGTNKGLNQLLLKNDSIKLNNYNSTFAFKNTKINDIAFVNDTIYLATDKELIYFNIAYLNHKKIHPKCLINGLYINAKKINNNDLFNIDYNTNNVSISFTGISYLDQGNLTYYFKLDHADKNWSTTLETQINYKTLSPKSYTFSVYSKNGFGKKSDIATISFTIKKPFWQQWWFILLATGILLGVLFLFWKWRLNHLNKKFEKERKALFLENENIALENQMLALEQKALRLQMNPHFIFNALNTIKGYYSEGNIREASNYISKFSKLLRLLLENIEQFIPLSLEIEMLNLYLELTKVRYQDKFEYTITVENNLNTSEINVPTLLLQPLVENAIIHGIAPKKKKGTIEISFKIKNNQLICSVKDNGVGRRVAKKTQYKEYESKALDITEERLQLIEIQEGMKCSLQFYDYESDGISEGTKVEIAIPIIKK